MRKKVVIGVVIGGVIGVGYWLISPLFITKQANETLQDIIEQETGAAENQQEQQQGTASQEQIETIKYGTFEGLTGHAGFGGASLLKIRGSYYVRFDEDFQTTNGPDLFVHLGRNGEYDANANLGSLKGSAGGQNYKIPDTIDISQYNEVWVWCRAFSVGFTKAVLVTP
jgi:hypothetical protein